MTVGFHHGILADSYEYQANKQGFTFGDMAEYIDSVGFGIVSAHFEGCITEKEYAKILPRFQKMLVKNLKPKGGD